MVYLYKATPLEIYYDNISTVRTLESALVHCDGYDILIIFFIALAPKVKFSISVEA